ERDLLAREAIRVAGTVPALVVVTDENADGIRELDPLEQRGRDGRVLAHDRELLEVEGPAAREPLVGQLELAQADVVEETGHRDLLDRFCPELQMGREAAREKPDGEAVRFQLRVRTVARLEEEVDEAPVRAPVPRGRADVGQSRTDEPVRLVQNRGQ